MKYKEKLFHAYVSSGQARVNFATTQNDPYVLQLIKKHFPSDKQVRIADLGCGYGKYLLTLKKNEYTNLIGVDISSEQVEAAKSFGLTHVQQGELMTFLHHQPPGIDIILLMDIIEHLTFQEVFDLLELAKTRLSINGKLILHVPNAEGIFGMRIRYGDITHESAYSPSSIRQLLYSNGFKKVDVYEDKPLVYSLTSFIRRVLWSFFTLRYRILLMAETGEKQFVLSQNMLVVACI
jgi:predicted TPR repeat methyltransferase